MNKFEQVVQTQNMTSLPKPGMMEMGMKTVTAIGLAGSCEVGAPNTSMVLCRRIWGVRPHWCSSISWRKQPLGCNSGITRKLLLHMGCGRKELISLCFPIVCLKISWIVSAMTISWLIHHLTGRHQQAFEPSAFPSFAGVAELWFKHTGCMDLG